MIKPIPKRLLPHNCTFQEYLGNTGEGDTWGIVSPISCVKIEEKTQGEWHKMYVGTTVSVTEITVSVTENPVADSVGRKLLVVRLL